MTEAELLADARPVTHGFLADVLHRIGVKTGESIEKRIARALAPLNTRLSAAEVRVGALSMMMGKGDASGRLEAFEALEKRIALLEGKHDDR